VILLAAPEEALEPTDDRLLADALFGVLSEAIVRGDLTPGMKLSEPRLAAQYRVSRGPLREAIHRLEERRLVVRSPRQGARVVTLSPASVIELFKIREVLEGLAAREAAAHARSDEIDALRAMLATHRLALDKPDAVVYWQDTANADFHFFVARIARSEQLFDLLCNQYYTLFRLYRMQHRLVPGRAQLALREHERIVEAIADGDGELAEMLMRRHVAAARHGIETSVGSEPG
jgi:DNA-binding GntR family transcriptional regulator